MKPNHMLPLQGRLYVFSGWTVRRGVAMCTCGTQSDALPTATARREWHRQHRAGAVAVERRARLRLLGRDGESVA
jgi:hypothetical protein